MTNKTAEIGERHEQIQRRNMRLRLIAETQCCFCGDEPPVAHCHVCQGSGWMRITLGLNQLRQILRAMEAEEAVQQ